MVYKSLNGLVPTYLQSIFTDRSNITQYELRDTVGKLAVPLPRTNYLKNSLVTKVRCFGTAYHPICGKHKLSMVFELVAVNTFLSL